ncbi:MAG: AAA family ATPase [Gemmatirosa sp.]
MRLEIPDPSLVLLVGPTSSGKSTFARAHFAPTAIVSSDACRAIVADDENDQSATDAAFQVVHLIVAKRLERARLTVVDATNLRPGARSPLMELAHRCHLPTVVIALDLPEAVCEARRAARDDRDARAEVLHRQREQLHRGLDALTTEGHWAVHVLRTPDDVEAARIVRVPLPADRRTEAGPFDVVGDVHGCLEELEALLARLGYLPPDGGAPWRHPEQRRVVFVGDLVDRGPRVVDTLRVAMDMVDGGTAMAVPGNHDDKLLRKLQGRTVHVAHGLEESLAELAQAPTAFVDRARDFLTGLPSHLVLDGGRLVVAHAGLPQGLHGRESRRVRDRALFGETTGVLDAHGLPMRVDWAARYLGGALVVFGHTPVLKPRWRNQTVDIDTGCVFGGALTALRWPERELVSVPAVRAHAVPARPVVADPFVSPEVVRRREREQRAHESAPRISLEGRVRDGS